MQFPSDLARRAGSPFLVVVLVVCALSLLFNVMLLVDVRKERRKNKVLGRDEEVQQQQHEELTGLR